MSTHTTGTDCTLDAAGTCQSCGVYRDVDDDDSNCNAHGEGAGGSSWRTVDYDPDEDMA